MAIGNPETYNEYIRAIQIYRSARIGPRNYHALMAQSESYDEAWDSLLAAYQKRGLDKAGLASEDSAQAEFDCGHSFGARFIGRAHSQYPESLRALENAPPFLWAKGNLDLLCGRNIGVIGTRNASIEGARLARSLARDLVAAGYGVVSGLARGIDAAAHEGALSVGTIGVVAGGLDVFYPKQNEALQREMFTHGLVVSEMPFGHAPQAKNFPQRNRILAGIADAILVIEATERSGTMITAGIAIELAREIMAVPGHPFSPRAAGTNRLIKDGATMICSAEDMLARLQQILDPPDTEMDAPTRDADEPPISAPPLDIDALAQQGLDEIEGRVVRGLDGEIARA